MSKPEEELMVRNVVKHHPAELELMFLIQLSLDRKAKKDTTAKKGKGKKGGKQGSKKKQLDCNIFCVIVVDICDMLVLVVISDGHNEYIFQYYFVVLLQRVFIGVYKHVSLNLFIF